ncbi:hypothetical protein ACFPOA_12670 [Lysobacter niabensis]
MAVLCAMAPTAVLAEEVTCASVKNARTECPMKTGAKSVWCVS